MESEKIIQDLNRRFAEPLPEFYKRRIIVWHDDEVEYSEDIGNISLDNAKIAVLTHTNNFYVKKLLAVDEPTSNFLLYCPFAYESPEDNWLLDIELYSEEYRADLISSQMDEMGISQSPGLRKCFKTYRKFFNAKERRSKITALSSLPSTPAQLQMSIMAVLAGVKEATPNQIIKAVLKDGLFINNNEVYKSFVNYDINEMFWRMVKQGTGYYDSEPDICALATHILLTATSRTVRAELLKGLEGFIASSHQAYCYDLVSEWLHEDVASLYGIAEYVESETMLPQRFIKLNIEDIYDTEVFPCINEVILRKIMTDIKNHIIDIDLIEKTVDKRRTCAWYEDVACFYEGILQVSKMQAFYKSNSASFHTLEAKKVWEEYTSKYYIMDTYYRKFHESYDNSLKNYHLELSDLFASVVETVEGLYKNWFLENLSENWAKACEDELREYGKLIGIPQQTKFYSDRIATADSKVYVIISDALRYEVAVSLTEQLQRETQSKVSISSMQGIFPTITKFGMAALLPHKNLSVEVKTGKTEGLSVLADGQSTEANNRDKLLKTGNEKSVALKYDNIIGMKRTDRQALVKGMDVVYIYHDTIDAAGHQNKSIFGACEETIDELKNMVRIITNEFGGAHILITSDHGFLYTHSPLKEDDKVDKTTESTKDIEVGRRYAIMQKDAKPEYLLPIKFLDGESDYSAFAPRGSIRIKISGGSTLNFVHGGISPQETVVPVIDYHFLRNDSKEYKKNKSKYDTKPVTVNLLSASHKISNMIFSLNFYQKDAVSFNREAATYKLYFVDGNNKEISDVSSIIADKTSENPQERMFRCNFNLKSLKYDSTESYYLVIEDENGLQTREEFQIDIAFAVDEFDFFE